MPGDFVHHLHCIHGDLLPSVLMNKLPPDAKLVESRRVTDEQWCLDFLLKVVDEEVEARERAGLGSTFGGPAKKTHGQRDDQSTVASLFAKGVSVSCVYCSWNHLSKFKWGTDPEL